MSNSSGFYANLDELTKRNNNYRHVIFTTKQQQLVLMNIQYDDEIGMESHPHTTQFIKIEKGSGLAIVNNKQIKIKKGDCLVIASGTNHNIISKAKDGLKLYTIYSPPEHKDGLIQKYNPLHN